MTSFITKSFHVCLSLGVLLSQPLNAQDYQKRAQEFEAAKVRQIMKGLIAVGDAGELGFIFGPQLTECLLGSLIIWQGRVFEESMNEQLTRVGESLDPATLWPEELAPDQNFCATPSLEGIASVVHEKDLPAPIQAKVDALHALSRPLGKAKPFATWPNLPDWEDLRKKSDQSDPSLLLASEPDPVKAVLAAFAPRQSLLNELASAAIRPNARFLPAPSSRPANDLDAAVPSFVGSVVLAAKGISVYCRACLANGDVKRAAEMVRVLFAFQAACVEERSLGGALTGSAVGSLLSSCVLDGVLLRKWTAAHFAEWQQRFASQSMEAALLKCWRGEMIQVLQIMTRFMEDANATLWAPGDLLAARRVFYGTLPWIRQNRAVAVELQLRHILLPLKQGGFAALLAGRERREKDVKARRSNLRPEELFAIGTFAVYEKVFLDLACKEMIRRHMIIICALESCRLRQNSYPASLLALPREILAEVPKDLDGSLIRYRKDSAPGRYRLWSVGADFRDDSKGIPDETNKSSQSEKLDWVLVVR